MLYWSNFSESSYSVSYIARKGVHPMWEAEWLSGLRWGTVASWLWSLAQISVDSVAHVWQLSSLSMKHVGVKIAPTFKTAQLDLLGGVMVLICI